MDRPALADPTTLTLFNVMTRSVRARSSALVYLPIVLVVLGWLISFEVHAGPGLIVVACVVIAVFVALMGQAVRLYVQFGRWAKRAGTVLSTQPWRPVPAVVTEHGVIEVHEDGAIWQLRTHRLRTAAVELVARTRRVWLAGPDAKGWLSFRFDGARMPYPARRTSVPFASAAREPAPPGSTGTAADDRVAAAAATELRRFFLRVQWRYLLAVVAAGVLAAGLSMMSGASTGWVVLSLLLAVPLLSRMVRLQRASRDYQRLGALLAAGPWERVDVELEPWRTRLGTLATARGTMRLDDGTPVGLTISGSLSLLATIKETGMAWLADEPRPGRKLAVGFPGYPLLGVAVLS